MMASPADEWNEVADAVAGLAMKLKLHVEQAAAEPADEVNNAVDSVAEAVDRAFDALRGAVQDPAVQDDVREVATRLCDALTNTLSTYSAAAKRPTSEPRT